jgi:hypothetical protein
MLGRIEVSDAHVREVGFTIHKADTVTAKADVRS